MRKASERKQTNDALVMLALCVCVCVQCCQPTKTNRMLVDIGNKEYDLSREIKEREREKKPKTTDSESKTSLFFYFVYYLQLL